MLIGYQNLETAGKVRDLVLVLGDQLDIGSPVFDDFDKKVDLIWMTESSIEAEYVWSTKARIAIFLASMRHFRDSLRRKGFAVDYHALGDEKVKTTLASELKLAAKQFRPRKLIVVEPGVWHIKEILKKTARELGSELNMRRDRYFYCSHEEFGEHASERTRLRLELFYRKMRRKIGVLMDSDQPVGGVWNYDAENRQNFGKGGPGEIRQPMSFRPDRVTRGIIALVEKRYADHPGGLKLFDWPVTRKQASAALEDFIENRLVRFGPYQDAMWAGVPYLYHSRLSNAMNLHLLDPRDVVAAAEQAYMEGRAPLRSVEGFIRQIIGWREYIRGVYWRFMPDYEHMNVLGHDLPLPPLYWTGNTDMACLRDCVTQTLERGYAHHIQRLMVTGLFAQLFAVDPHEVHKWYLAVYVDAIEWVEMPNVLGMSQFADGGLIATKPYVATGKYIQRMSNYCVDCRYDPARKTGDAACPFTTLYWDFLMRQDKLLRRNSRMSLQVKNADRLDRAEKQLIRKEADALRSRLLAEQGRY